MDGAGLGLLLAAGRIRRVVTSSTGEDREFARRYLAGELHVRSTPQGTLAERLRAGGAGILASSTTTGPAPSSPRGPAVALRPRRQRRRGIPPQEVRVFGGRTCVLEEAITTDVALVHAARADRQGDRVFHATARDFDPPAALAARLTVVEAEEVAGAGEIDLDQVDLPGTHV